MRKLFSLVFLLCLFAVPVQAKEVVTEEVYHEMLREYYAAEIEYFESQGEVIECIAFGRRLFVRYAPEVGDVGTIFVGNLYK